MAVNINNDNPSLAPRDTFRKSTNTAIGLSKTIDVSTVAILEQPDFDHLDGAKSIQVHQKASKVTAATWRKSVRSALFSCNDAIIAYNNQFSSFYDSMLSFANDIGPDEKKTAEARSNLIEALNELKSEINHQQQRTTDASNQLKDFLASMINHSSGVTSDMNIINAKYESDKGVIADINSHIDANNIAMSKDLVMMGLGGGGMVVGGLTIAVGIALWIESAGGSTAIIAAGIAVEAGASTAVGIGVDDYNKKSSENATLLSKLSEINTEIAIARHLLTSVGALVTSIQNVVDAVNDLSAQWSQLDRDYDNVIEALNSTNVDKLRFIIVNHLNAAKKAWGELSDDAHQVKKNLFEGLKIDDKDANQAKPGQIVPLPGNPNDHFSMPIPDNSDFRVLLSMDDSVPVACTSAVALKSENLNLKAWVEEASRLMLDFDQLLQNTTSVDVSKAPQNVVDTKSQVSRLGPSSLNSAVAFLTSLEDLSKLAPILRHTALLPDSDIYNAGMEIFKQLSAKIESAKKFGAVALNELNAEESVILLLNAATNGWITSLKAQSASEKSLINEAMRLRDEAIKEKEKSKNDSWWCFLGAVACIAVAIEQSQKISSANAKINELNRHISETSSELSQVTATMSSVNHLDSRTTLLVNCFEQVLKIAQMIFVSVDGIISNYDSTTSFVIKAHLNAAASQIDDCGNTLLKVTSNMMMLALRYSTENTNRNASCVKNRETNARRMNTCHNSLLQIPRSLSTRAINMISSSSNDEQSSLMRDMQQLTSYAINLQSAAMLSSTQPKLAYVETLLQQDQQIFVGHALKWRLNYSSKVIGVLSRLRVLGNSILFVLESIQERVNKFGKDHINEAVQGLEAIDADMSRYCHFLFESQMIARQFLISCNDDDSRFETVGEQLRYKLEGKHGEMKALEDQEASLSLQLTEALEHVVNRSTQLLLDALEWEAVFAVSLAVGQIEFAAVEGAVVMDVVGKGVNVVLKKASAAGATEAKKRLASLMQDQDDIVSPIITKRAETLMAMSLLSADLSVLHVLLGSQKCFSANSIRLLQVFEDLTTHFSEQQSRVYAIKLHILAGKKQQALTSLESFSIEWKSISSVANSLEQSFVASN